MSSGSDIPKITFQLTAHDERLEVRATAPGGEGKAETSLPPRDLLDRLVERDLTNIPSSVLKSVGKTLYQCLMVGDVARLAADMLEDGRRSGQSVQFELRFDTDQVSLAQYPWEVITNDFDQFLVRDGLVDVTRYINYPQPPSSFDTELQNTLLLQVVSQPSNFPSTTAINLTIEKIETLRHATFEQFLRELLIKRLPLWAVQFNGHGALLAQCRKCEAVNALEALTCHRCSVSLSDAKLIGVLAFERNGDIDWVPTEEVGSVLFNAKVQLAMLMLLAGETVRLEDRLVFNGLAPSLILAGVPAVVGLQYPVLDDFAVSFFNIFYTTLLEQNDVLVALRTARSLNRRGAWYSPVLYLRHQKKDMADEPLKSTYHVRNIDTAVPAQVQVGTDFLVRLRIRQPESKPLTGKELHKELDVPEDVPINTQEFETDIKFEPIQGRKLRRGEVEVQLSSPRCEVTPRSIKLFVDEDLDAPAAIFTVRAKQTGPVSLFFSVWQDGGQLVSIIHSIQVTASSNLTQGIIKMGSNAVPVEGGVKMTLQIGNTISSDVHGKSQRAIKRYHLSNIRILLKEGFTSSELRDFCFDTPDFRPVHNQVAENPGTEDIVRKIVEYAELKLLIEPILDWARQNNPARYEQHQPYYPEDINPSNTAEQSVPPPPSLLASDNQGRSEIANPGITGASLPEHLIEPQELINYCRNWLAGQARSNIAISGEHGFGKTSLLRDLLKPIAQKEQWGGSTHLLFVYLDCSTITPFSPNLFWHRVLEKLIEEVNDNFALQDKINLLLRQSVEIDADQVQNLFPQLKQQQLSLVLLLDEFDVIVKTDPAKKADIGAFLTKLRAFHDPFCATLITSTCDRLDFLCADLIEYQRGSPFYNLFKFAPPPLVSPDEFNLLLTRILAKTGFEFKQADRDFLYWIAGPHPGLLQLAGSQLLKQPRQTPLDPQIAEKIIKNFEREAEPHFAIFWRKLSPAEQALLILLILSYLARQSFTPLDPSAEEIRDLLLTYEHDLLPLEARGLIQAHEDTYQIFSVAFAKWIVRKLAAEDKTEFAKRYQTIDKKLYGACQQFRKLITHPAARDKLIQALIGPLPQSTQPDLSMSMDVPPRTPLSSMLRNLPE